MKRILLISNKVMHYRVSIYNYFSERFRSRGYELFVRANMLQKENPYNIAFNFSELPFDFSSYRKEILKIKPDYIILFLHLKDLIIFPLIYWLKKNKFPVLLWTKGANLDDPNNVLKNMIFHHLQSMSAGIILYSRNELRFIKKKNHDKVTIAPNTINYLDFPNIDIPKEQIRREFNIRFKKVALFVGRMESIEQNRKKVDHAIDIFRTIDNPDYGLIIVGAGLEAALQEKLNKNNTLYLGEVYDAGNIGISKIFKMADIFLMPGHVGLSINQAFCWGLPVLTEDGKQPPEISYLVNGRNGFIVRENDVEDLKGKLLLLFENDDLRLELGTNAQKDIHENASVDIMFKGFLDNIRRIESAR